MFVRRQVVAKEADIVRFIRKTGLLKLSIARVQIKKRIKLKYTFQKPDQISTL